jgi:hypothetical protein
MIVRSFGDVFELNGTAPQSGPLHLTFGIPDLATCVVFPKDIVKCLQQSSYKSDAFCTDVDFSLISALFSGQHESDDRCY